jgi:energy-coupling factor transporter ATP-binding protein EcfA2
VIRLRAVRLVNWYHFADETLRLQGSLLLLGDNGSGKSTVLDAVQWALIADQQQVRFNKAANEQSRRNLHGYIRWRLGSEDETRPGQVRYGRGACTAYVMLEFADERDPARDFAAGIVMEASEADSSVSRAHFVLPRGTVADVPAIAPGDLVRTLRDFRVALREMPQARLFPDAGTYRDELRHRLGTLPEAFHRLIVKALDFKPIGQVRDFVFNYLLDARPVDTATLQANLEHYKQLEAQARDAERRLAALDAVCAQGERIGQERRTAESHRYLWMRADVELAEARERATDEAISAAELRQTVLGAELGRAGEQLRFLDGERDRLAALLLGTPGYRELQALERELDTTRRAVGDAADAEACARRILEGQTAALATLSSQEARDLRRARPALFADEALVGAAEEPAVVARLRETLARDGALAGRDLATWTRRLGAAVDALGLARVRLGDRLEAARQEGLGLEAEQADLERGRRRYPDGAEALLHLLRTRLRGAREPQTLAELIEVPAPRWRDAVEGYLNTRRFDVIVAPEDFPRALGLYERHKRSWTLPGRGPVFIAGVGLVDAERIMATPRRAERRSLAEQVETADPLARGYVDFLLGDVMCCDDEQELRRHRHAITDTVMVYRNGVARQTPPEVFSRHYIGEAARVRRLEEIARRLAELGDEIIGLARDLDWLERASAACRKAQAEAVELPRLVEEAERLADLRARAVLLQRQLDRVDRREIAGLELELDRVRSDSRRLADTRDRLQRELGEVEGEARRLAVQRAEDERARAAAAEALGAAFGAADAERRDAWELRYGIERKERSPAEVGDVFERQFRNIDSRVNGLVLRLVHLKTEYVNAYGLAADVEGETWEEFAGQRDLWRESRLPEYRERIAKAKDEAIQQLAEDIIFRLRENLVDVRRQLEELNRALRDVPFGSERYQFTLEVAADHRAFHDLIMEAGRFEKESLFGATALADAGARRTLEELFERLVQSEARQVKTDLESRADYREYFDYDLRILHADGSQSSWDRVAGDRSGGETQTPYYIAVFASMYRLYRALAPDGRPRAGLVLLDEAFSKMDEARIAATLRFARDLGLQLVMATPKERSELVAPWVETSLYIHKDAATGIPAVLDFTKEFKPDGEVREA